MPMPAGRFCRKEPLNRFVGHVHKSRRLPSEQLLPEQAVVDNVERVLEHPLAICRGPRVPTATRSS